MNAIYKIIKGEWTPWVFGGVLAFFFSNPSVLFHNILFLAIAEVSLLVLIASVIARLLKKTDNGENYDSKRL